MKKVFWVLVVTAVMVVIFAVFRKSIPGKKDGLEKNDTGEVYFDDNYKSAGCNIILISIDTLRADHLGCYGYSKNTTPNIDKFSRDSVLFENTIAQAPSTEPAHASIFTSLIPSHHGAFYSDKKPIPQKTVTMAEILKGDGYKTISFNGGGQVAAEFGFDQGFDLYSSFPGRIDHLDKVFIGKVEAVMDWIKNNPNEKFFAFLHTFEVHHPYTPEKEYLRMFDSSYSGALGGHISRELLANINEGRLEMSAEDKQHIINAYDGEIFSMDKAFGVLVDFLKKEGLYENTLIIFTSDHGEEFGEHGRMGWHGHALYDEQLKVPLIIKLMNSRYASTIIGEQTRSLDILPTVLDVLNIPALECFEGVSLFSRFKKRNRTALFAVSQQDTSGQTHPTSIRTNKWKLYDEKLYNLESDPLEQNEVQTGYGRIREELRSELDYILSQKQSEEENESVDLSEETLKTLKSLGYLE
jgi:arylsulfatase A-like enzyme